MTILSRLARDMLEKLLGTFHEGPVPPPRLAEEVRLFRALAIEAPTEEQWEAFATQIVERAYSDGFVRGVHWLERSWDGPTTDPEKILEEQAHARPLAADPAWAHVLEHPMDRRAVHTFHEQIANATAAGIDVHLTPGRRER